MKKWLNFGAYLTFLGFVLYITTSFINFYQLKTARLSQNSVLGWENYIAQTTCAVSPYTCGDPLKIFNPEVCYCTCANVSTCPTGQNWNDALCSCVDNSPSGGSGGCSIICPTGMYPDASCNCVASTYPTPTTYSTTCTLTCPVGSHVSSSCNCVPDNTTCITPIGGCGTNYYWDSGTCSCKPSGSSCITPTGGCPVGYYWSSYSCSCVYSGSTCTAPSSGCGTGYYWDSGSCACRPSTTTCVIPVGGCGTNYYWDSTSCTCVNSATTCTMPLYGCGTNYYWNATTCSCMPTTSYCSPPTYGCASGYFWDYTNCVCKPSSTYCTTPSSGCGSGYYWDSATCICKPSMTTSCTSPTNGCGVGYYWDQGTCVCKAGSSTYAYCSPPAYGCGTYYYWDSTSCSCKPSSSTCYPPTSGCGINFYWDNPSCSCRPFGLNTTYCSPPSSGCGINNYWDSISCSCKAYTKLTATCYPPPYGCGNNYFWDSYSCSCRPSTSCYPPTSGCGSNYYWDGNACSCKFIQSIPTSTANSTTSCYPPTSGCGTGYKWDSVKCACSYSQAYFDRLSYEKPEIISCIDGILSDSEYNTLRYLMGTNEQERNMITSLHEKVKSCYEKYTQYYTQNVVMETTVKEKIYTPLQNENCLKELIGEKAFQEIYSGVRQASYSEKFAFNKCYQVKSTQTPVILTKYNNISDSTVSCLKSVLGVDVYDKVNNNEKEVPYELKNEVDKCFGVSVKPFESTVGYKSPEEVVSCLEKALGKDNYFAIQNGSRSPTDEEKKKGSNCFDELNEIQRRFVPPPVEQVPYLEENNESVNVTAVKQETAKKKKKIIDNKVVFSGKGPKDSIVTIYVFSDPVVVTTKTDENGDWVYELKDPVTGGKHIAYATVKAEGQNVRSSLFNFEVSAAEPDLKEMFIEEIKVATPVSKYMIYSLVILGVGLVILLTGIFVIRRAHDNEHNFLSTFKRMLTGYS